MASEKINVKIEADYDDSEAKQALKDAEKLDGTEAVVQIDAESDEAVRSIREVDEALEDVPSKADKVAAAIVEMSNKIDAETRDAAAAADMLKVALGDAAERIDATEAVAELRKMGLTADEVRADVDQLADALKHADTLELGRARGELDTLGTAAGTTKTKVGDLGNTSDQSRSVLANMTGNAAQDLGALGGVAGTVGVGIGQLAEYATEGNISLGNLAKVAGPMAGLTLVLAGVNKLMAERQRIDVWRTEQVKGYAAAVEELGVGLGAIEEHLTNVATESFETATGITEFITGGAEIENIAAMFGVMGVNIRDVSSAIAAGKSDSDAAKAAVEALEQQMAALGFTGDDLVGPMLEYVTEQQDAYAESTANAAGEAAFFASTAGDINKAWSANAVEIVHVDTMWQRLLRDLANNSIETERATEAWNELRDSLGLTDDEMAALTQTKLDDRMSAVADAIVEAAAASEDSAESHQAAADALQNEADAANNAADALSEQANAQRRAVDASYNLRDARQSQVDAIEAVRVAESEHGADSVEYRESLEDLTSSIQDTADAEVRLATEQEASEGATLSAVDAIDVQNDSLIRQASQLQGPSRRAIVQHIAALNGIPPSVISEILALLDEGKVEEAEAKITELSEPRDLEVKAQMNRAAAAVAEAAINRLTAPEDLPIEADLNHAQFDRELRALLIARQLTIFANIVGGIGGGGAGRSVGTASMAAPTSATTVYVNVPRGTRPDDMVRAGDRYARRNGHARAHRR